MKEEAYLRFDIIYKSIISGRCKVVCYDPSEHGPLTGNILYSTIAQVESLDPRVFNVSHDGKNVRRDHTAIRVINGQDVSLNLYIPALGGKGGFGSMLRAIGAQIEKTTNREACRDLGGRRLRDVHTEKRIKDWISKHGERKKEQEERRKKKLAKLAAEPKVEFNDDDYFQTREHIPDQLEDAIEAGLKKAKSSTNAILQSESSAEKSPPVLPLPSSSSSSSPSPSETITKPQSVQELSTEIEASSTLSPTDTTEPASNLSKKRKTQDSQSVTCSSQKRSKSILWTGVDDDDTSTDEDE